VIATCQFRSDSPCEPTWPLIAGRHQMISRRMGRTTDVGTTGAFHFPPPPLLRASIGDTRSSHGRRWYNCTWLSADARRAPAARHLAASFHSSGAFYTRITSVGVQLSTGSEPSLSLRCRPGAREYALRFFSLRRSSKSSDDPVSSSVDLPVCEGRDSLKRQPKENRKSK